MGVNALFTLGVDLFLFYFSTETVWESASDVGTKYCMIFTTRYDPKCVMYSN